MRDQKKKRKLLSRREYRDKETRKRQRGYEKSYENSDDSSSNEYKPLRKKRRLDSNKLKKGGKYVSQQKSLKELKEELVGLIKYAKA